MAKAPERIAESLSEHLQHYADEVEEAKEEGEKRDNFSDDHIVDELFDMHEVFYKDGVEEGRYYQSVTIFADHPIKVFDVVEVNRVLSDERDKVKVMAITSVSLLKNGSLMVEVLGAKIKD